MQNIGAMSSYMFIIKNQLPSVLWTMMCPLDENGQTTCPDLNSPDIPWYFNGNYIVILIVCVVVVPLASLKSIEFLGYTSGNDQSLKIRSFGSLHKPELVGKTMFYRVA